MNEGPSQDPAVGTGGDAGRRPLLRPVSSDEPVPGVSEPGGFFRGRGVLLLVLVLVAVLLGYGFELARSRSLETKILGLETELVAAKQQLQFYEQRMVEVRHAVSGLSERLTELQTLVREPVDGDATAPSVRPALP